MHNLQHSKHQETQTIYPSTGSSPAVHFSHFFIRIAISWLIFSSLFPFPSLSQLTHLTKLSDLLSLGESRTSCKISQPFHDQICEDFILVLTKLEAGGSGGLEGNDYGFREEEKERGWDGFHALELQRRRR
ncbi:hypothetical protein Hanom_Chr07g00618961 [Helianthus anomalus]